MEKGKYILGYVIFSLNNQTIFQLAGFLGLLNL